MHRGPVQHLILCIQMDDFSSDTYDFKKVYDHAFFLMITFTANGPDSHIDNHIGNLQTYNLLLLLSTHQLIL